MLKRSRMGNKGGAAALKKARPLALVQGEKRGSRDLRGLLEAAPDSIVVVDRAGAIVHVNSQTERLFRYGREELLGKQVHLLLPDFRPTSIENVFARPLVPPTDSRVIELLARRKDGVEFAADLSLGLLESPSGPLGMVFVRDTSEQQRIERTLRQSEAYFRLLCRASEKLARSLDYRQTLQHAAEIAVPEFADCCVVVGITADGQLGSVASAQRKTLRADLVEELSLAHRAIARDTRSLLAQVIRDRQTLRHDPSLEKADHPSSQVIRELTLHSAIYVPLMARDQLLGVLCCYAATRDTYKAGDQDVADDLGHRAALALDNALLHDKERRARDAAQRAAEVRDEVLSIVAHDLRNPLNTIALWAQLLLRAPTPPKTLKAAELIRSSAHLMNGMIEDLLAHARLEGGGLSIDRQQHKTAKIINDVVDAFTPMAQEKGIKLTGKCSDPGMLWCDRGRLHQVLGNLLANALKFTPRGGSIGLEARREGASVRIDVADTGAGISAAACEHIFERNWRGAGDKTPGLGLGLYIAKLLIEAHGGQLRVVSHVGEGTTFTITLPGDGGDSPPQPPAD